MTPSAAEIESIVTRALPGSKKRDAQLLRQMLAGLRETETTGKQGALEELCAIGVAYGWRELERTIQPAALRRTSARTKASLRRHLQEILEWITRPSFDLEWRSFTLALEALGLKPDDPSAMKEKFLGAEPGQRLFGLFKKLPVLAALWSAAIDQWRKQVAEILTRAVRDERAIARTFFENAAGGRISDVRLGLSDRHGGGRSVALVAFEQGRVIYKPRNGGSEAEWAALLRWMNGHGFQPRLKEARMLRRKNYHWMEVIEPDDCRDAAAVRRFYERLGGLIAAAYLLNAVDCHRDNLIAAGEQPVLVDIDALWHVSAETRRLSPTALLNRTGFFPNADRASLQSRSSILGKTRTGRHVPRIDGRPQAASRYVDQLVTGFERGWKCVAGKPAHRAALLRRRRQIWAEKRRWIYGPTMSYGAVIRASLQPAALTSAAARGDVIQRLAARKSSGAVVRSAEIKALARLDIPYFTRSTKERMGPIPRDPPPKLRAALLEALGMLKPAPRRR